MPRAIIEALLRRASEIDRIASQHAQYGHSLMERRAALQDIMGQLQTATADGRITQEEADALRDGFLREGLSLEALQTVLLELKDSNGSVAISTETENALFDQLRGAITDAEPGFMFDHMASKMTLEFSNVMTMASSASSAEHKAGLNIISNFKA